MTWEGVGRVALSQLGESVINNGFDFLGTGAQGVNLINAIFNNWGSDKYVNQWQAIWDNEVATFRNIGASKDIWEFSSSVSQSGYNDFLTAAKDVQFSFDKNAQYHGLISDERGYSAQLWTMGDLFGREMGAATQGHHIQLDPHYYYEFPEEGGWNASHTIFTSTRGSVLRHELTHVGQFNRYGWGGTMTRSTYGHHASEFTDAYHEELFRIYGNATWLDMTEYEAQEAELGWQP